MGAFQIIVLISFLATALACTENEIQPVKGSCTKYSICKNGNLKIEKCPFGKKFSSDLKICEIFYNVNCTEGTECEDGLLYEHENPSAFYTCLNGRLRLEFCPLNHNFNGDGCIESDKPDTSMFLYLKKNRNCREGDKKPDNDCQKFLECVNGDWAQKACPPKQAFDITRKDCKFIWEASCSETSCIEGYTYPVQNNNKFYTQCINHQRVKKECGWFHVYDNNKHDCVFKLMNTDSNIFKQVCTNGGKQPDSSTSYLRCMSGQWKKLECPNGEIFDSKNLECTKCLDGKISSSSCDSFEVCDSGVLKKYICLEGTSFDGSKCAFNHKCKQSRQKREVKEDKNCINGGRQPSQNETTNEYQVCENGKWVVAKCGVNETFDVNTLSCKVDTGCEKGSKMIKHGFCKTFLLCRKGKWVEGTCPNKHIFDGFQCVANAICNRYSSIRNQCDKYKDSLDGQIYNCPPGNRFDKVSRECVFFAEARCDSDEMCYENDKIGDPKDCSKYKECYYVDKSCSSWKSGWLYKFDAIKQKCVLRLCADCTPSVATENLLLKSDVCEEGAIEPIEGTCRLYRVCRNGVWENEKCSPCKRFNATENLCVRVWSEPCDKGLTDPPIIIPSTSSLSPTDTWGTGETSVHTPTPKPRHCIEGDRRGIVADCKKYKECVDGDWEDKSCRLWAKFDTVSMDCLLWTSWKAKCA